jgi:exonuclease III
LRNKRFCGDGQIIGLKFDVFNLINEYFPSGRRDYSRVDCYLISSSLYKNVGDVEIYKDIFGADHYPVTTGIISLE